MSRQKGSLRDRGVTTFPTDRQTKALLKHLAGSTRTISGTLRELVERAAEEKKREQETAKGACFLSLVLAIPIAPFLTTDEFNRAVKRGAVDIDIYKQAAINKVEESFNTMRQATAPGIEPARRGAMQLES